MCVCARARGFCADAGACAGVRACVRAYVHVCGRAYVRAGARWYVGVYESAHARLRAFVGEHACALQWAGSRTCGCACGRIYKLCRPLIQTR